MTGSQRQSALIYFDKHGGHMTLHLRNNAGSILLCYLESAASFLSQFQKTTALFAALALELLAWPVQ